MLCASLGKAINSSLLAIAKCFLMSIPFFLEMPETMTHRGSFQCQCCCVTLTLVCKQLRLALICLRFAIFFLSRHFGRQPLQVSSLEYFAISVYVGLLVKSLGKGKPRGILLKLKGIYQIMFLSVMIQNLIIMLKYAIVWFALFQQIVQFFLWIGVFPHLVYLRFYLFRSLLSLNDVGTIE